MTEMCTCVGILVSNNSKHKVWVSGAPLKSASVVPLAELLSLPEPSRKERLKLAVKLASSVLQLHTTQWLQEGWGKHDIYFVQGDSSQTGSPSLETPVVCQAFSSDSSVPAASIESRFIHHNRNPSLFSLGIVLIELLFWKSVESLQAEELGSDKASEYIAPSLIDKVYRDACDNYGDSVRRCINGLDHKEIKLENEGFKNEVYLKVLRPLEKDLEHFYREPLEKIFEKRASETETF